jgi:hypothetical protein
MSRVYVINSRKEKEPFSFKKVYMSARRAGASKELAFKIAREIEKSVYSGIRTSEIFRKVLQYLEEEDRPSRIRFILKEAIRKLGPTGFPFEKFVGEIFKVQGYKIEFNLHLTGRCNVLYEIDFLACDNKEVVVGECKFHENQGERVDLKVALANFARFLDLKESKFFQKFKNYKIYPLIVTNAKFTNQIIRYSECVGQRLLGWKYPKEKGLERLIEDNKLYPITILPSLSRSMVERFSEKRIMLVRDLLKSSPEQISQKLDLPFKYIQKLFEEAKTIL